MKIGIICHGNVARSQILHHYLGFFADRVSLPLDLFSCGTAPLDAFPGVESMLAEVEQELKKRGLNGPVERNILDQEARQHLVASDLILVADAERRQEVLSLMDDQVRAAKVMLFYEYIGEGQKDFVDTFDADKGAQDPERFAGCFDELERIAKRTVECIQRDPESRRGGSHG